MRKNSVERLIVTSNMNHHYSVMMHHNNGTVMEPAEVLVERVLQRTLLERHKHGRRLLRNFQTEGSLAKAV